METKRFIFRGSIAMRDINIMAKPVRLNYSSTRRMWGGVSLLVAKVIEISSPGPGPMGS